MPTAVSLDLPSPSERVVPDHAEPRWSLPERIGFRLVFAYFILYCLPLPFGALPWTAPVEEAYGSLWQAIVPWVGEHVLGLAEPIAVVENGSGDTTYHYVLALCHLTLAGVITAVWSYLDRRRPSYAVLHEWLRVYLRFALATTMLVYGFIKIFPLQFSPPDARSLFQTYGESSPMGLMWTFMGFSTGYTMFAGLTEVVGGTLLMFRRTTLLGALVLLGVLGNVVMLNFCYDVPVKLYSAHLWVIAGFLAAPDARRLWSFFILQRAVPAPAVSPLSGRTHRIARVAFAVITLVVAVKIVEGSWSRYQEVRGGETVAVQGYYDVEEMTIDGQPVPPLVGDARRWKNVWVRSRGIWIYWMDGKAEPYRATQPIDGDMSLDLSPWDDEAHTRKGILDMRTVGDRVELDGTWDGKAVHARLRKVDTSQTLLMGRGFHWVQEQPFNR